jgi:hypothetical protein
VVSIRRKTKISYASFTALFVVECFFSPLIQKLVVTKSVNLLLTLVLMLMSLVPEQRLWVPSVFYLILKFTSFPSMIFF